jgi:hypothetical protein
MNKELIVAATTAALLVSGCSTRPRSFVPTLAMAPLDGPAYDKDLAACERLVAQGRRSGFTEALAIGGTGAAATTGAFFAAGPVVLSTASATVGWGLLAAVPVLGIAATVGASKAVRSSKEKEIKRAMTLCLAEHGHAVAEWNRLRQEQRSPGSADAPPAPHPSGSPGEAERPGD